MLYFQLRERAQSFFTDLCKQLLGFMNDREEDCDYTPCSIKRRRGGSLGHNSRRYKHHTYCQRSQSFCGLSSVDNNGKETTPHDYIVSDEKRRKHEIEIDNSCNSDSSSNSIASIPGSEEIARALSDDSLNPFERSDSNSSGYASQSETRISDQELSNVKDNITHNELNFFSKEKDLLSSSSVPYGCCPNVTISPLINHRLPSLSSISSGRNSSFDDVETCPPSLADVLIVSHGGFIKQLLQYFVDDLDCKIPGGRNVVMKICPNCSISKFTVDIQGSVDKPALACNVLFDKDHLSEMECVQTTDISL